MNEIEYKVVLVKLWWSRLFYLEIKLYMIIYGDNILCQATFDEVSKISNQAVCLMIEAIVKSYLKPHQKNI